MENAALIDLWLKALQTQVQVDLVTVAGSVLVGTSVSLWLVVIASVWYVCASRPPAPLQNV